MCRLKPIFSKIELIVYDFDGVMTNNQVMIDKDGNELVQVSRADGLGVAEFKKLGIKQLILSTEKNSIVSVRARKLKIRCIQNVPNKSKSLSDFCKKNHIKLENVIFIGNDINDKQVMEIVGFRFCPADARDEIKEISDQILISKGGCGVARELYDLLIEK